MAFQDVTIGIIEEMKSTDKEKEINWKISKFFALEMESYYKCPYFKFLNVQWYLKMDPSEIGNNDNLALLLKTSKTDSSCDLMCTFGIKKVDGSMVGITSLKYTLHPQDCNPDISLIVHKFFTMSELSRDKSRLVPLGNLIIMCNLKLLSGPLRIAELNTLLEDFKKLLTNGENCDTTLQLANREFKAHKIILAARSPVFAAMFKHETSEKQTGIVNIPDCDPRSFQQFLEFLYCGKVENISFRSSIHLYKTADKYDVQELKKFCLDYMTQNLKVENVCDVISFAYEYEERGLLDAAQAYFSENVNKIFVDPDFKALFKKNFHLAK